jgi:hypothetical protein
MQLASVANMAIGQFFILKFDFSTINRSTKIEDANTFLKTNIANSLRLFYKTYSSYLGGNGNKLFDNIDREDPSSSLLTCIESVRDATLTAREREGGSGIQGVSNRLPTSSFTLIADFGT